MYSYNQGGTGDGSSRGGSKSVAAALDFFGDLTTTGEICPPTAVLGEGERKEESVERETSERKRLARKRKRRKNSECIK